MTEITNQRPNASLTRNRIHAIGKRSFSTDPSDSHCLLRDNRKWTYLLSTTIKMSDKQSACIQIPKPHADLLEAWIEKIARHGQCSAIYVEDMPQSLLRNAGVKSLCEYYNVTLINLTAFERTPVNVIDGPWH